MTIFNIERAFKQKKERNWEKLYFCVDLHETVLEGKYNKFNIGANLYPYAQEVLTYLYSRKDIVLILWTSSHDDAIKEIAQRLDTEYGIKFHYINENPEVSNTELCDFSKKFYFNVLLDDKAGFSGEDGDWKLIRDELIKIGEWK